MPDVNAKVMSMVRDELAKNPRISTQDLFDKAKKIDRETAGLNIRQFHARYPLQVKRQNAPKRRRGANQARRGPAARGRRRGGFDRDAIRGVLQQLAEDIAGADDIAQVVRVIGQLDKYVDKVAKAAGAA